jgi:hypothetical protein
VPGESLKRKAKRKWLFWVWLGKSDWPHLNYKLIDQSQFLAHMWHVYALSMYILSNIYCYGGVRSKHLTLNSDGINIHTTSTTIHSWSCPHPSMWYGRMLKSQVKKACGCSLLVLVWWISKFIVFSLSLFNGMNEFSQKDTFCCNDCKLWNMKLWTLKS